jgi:hypothetical protein
MDEKKPTSFIEIVVLYIFCSTMILAAIKGCNDVLSDDKVIYESDFEKLK